LECIGSKKKRGGDLIKQNGKPMTQCNISKLNTQIPNYTVTP
jgi:hypothetical protein